MFYFVVKRITEQDKLELKTKGKLLSEFAAA